MECIQEFSFPKRWVLWRKKPEGENDFMVKNEKKPQEFLFNGENCKKRELLLNVRNNDGLLKYIYALITCISPSLWS